MQGANADILGVALQRFGHLMLPKHRQDLSALMLEASAADAPAPRHQPQVDIAEVSRELEHAKQLLADTPADTLPTGHVGWHVRQILSAIASGNFDMRVRDAPALEAGDARRASARSGMSTHRIGYNSYESARGQGLTPRAARKVSLAQEMLSVQNMTEDITLPQIKASQLWSLATGYRAGVGAIPSTGIPFQC